MKPSSPVRAMALVITMGLLSCAAMRTAPTPATFESASYVPLAMQLSWRPAPDLSLDTVSEAGACAPIAVESSFSPECRTRE
jgi:hypothetical protein